MAKWDNDPIVTSPTRPKWESDPIVEEDSFAAQAAKVVPEVGRVGARAIGEAVMAMPNLAEAIVNAIVPDAWEARMERIKPAPGFVPLKEHVRQAFEKVTTPQTKTGQSISNIIAAALAARTGGGLIGAARGAPVTAQALNQMTRVGAASGVGGEVAGLATGDDPVARVAGSLIGGGMYGLSEGALRGTYAALRGRGKSTTLAKKVTAGLTEEDVARSIADQQMARSMGVNVTAGQTLPGTNVPAFEAFATGQTAGQKLTDIFRQQPGQVTGLAQRFELGVPGRALPPSQLNVEARQAATAALKAGRAGRTAATRPLYTGEISEAGAKGLQKAIRAEIKKLPTELDDVKALKKLRLALTNKVVKKQPDGTLKTTRVPLTKTQDINKAFRSVKNSLARPGEGGKQFSREVRNKVEKVINDLKAKIGEEVPEYAKADEVFAEISRRVINPMKEGPAGKLAGATEYIPGQPAVSNYLTNLFNKGISGKGASEIELTRRQLLRAGDEGKAAFNDTFKTWLAEGLSESMKFEKGGLSPDVAKSIHAKFFGSEAKRQAFRDGLRGIARNDGLDIDKTVKGMENMMRTIEMAAARPGATGLSGGEVASSADTIAKQISGFTYLLPARGFLRFLNNKLKTDALGFVSDTLSTPEGIKKLYQMANANPGSRTAQALLGDFAATGIQPNLAQPGDR